MKLSYKIIIISLTFLWLPVITSAVSLEMPLPGLTSAPADPGVYVRYLFLFGLSALAFLSVGALVVGGIQYMLAGSLISSTEKAKTTMKAAIGGLTLLLCSYLLLYTIDPTLTNLSPRIPSMGNVPATNQTVNNTTNNNQATYTCMLGGAPIGSYNGLAACQQGGCNSCQLATPAANTNTSQYTCMLGGAPIGSYNSLAACRQSGCTSCDVR